MASRAARRAINYSRLWQELLDCACPRNGRGGTFPRPEEQGIPVPNLGLNAALATVRPIAVLPVPPADRLQWNATMATYHPLGFRRACGAR